MRQGSTDLLQEDPSAYVAISTRCAHLGCPVRFVEAAGNFICPCHGGVYDFQGKVIGGPPVRPLDRFQTRVRNGQVEIGPRYSVTSQLEPVRARDPGEFTGGIWEYLYPPRPDTPAAVKSPNPHDPGAAAQAASPASARSASPSSATAIRPAEVNAGGV